MLAYGRPNINQTPRILAKTAVAIGIANTGSIANDGALTLGTALAKIYSEGIYLYFPANAIAAGSAAGFYWVVMSSTTLGTIYNNTFDPTAGSIGFPAVPASPTAFVTTGPGAYTGDTATRVTHGLALPARSYALPGTELKINMWLEYNTAAGNKIFAHLFDSTVISTTTRSTTGGHDRFTARITAKASNKQEWFAPSESSTSTATGVSETTVDMTVATRYQYRIQNVTATNNTIVKGLGVELILPYP